VVVSPHSDDAVLSIGGTISTMTRRGIEVVVVTVFSGDPASARSSSYWDAARGPTLGQVVEQRRAEDVAAVGALDASLITLPFADNGYVVRRDPDEIWQQLGPALTGAAAVLLPGWPLSHSDHHYATMLVLERGDADVPVAFYAEQPYASTPPALLKAVLRGRTGAPLAHAYGHGVRWRRMRIDDAGIAAQRRAVAAYAGELANLGLRVRWSDLARRFAGEWIGVGEHVGLPSELGLG